MTNQDAQSKTPLNDVMIAMDVVDTLRHDQKLVDRELNDDQRRASLIDSLREIYKGQGIEVPDHILEEGVRALEEDRFTYKAPDAERWSTRLARAYVTRWQWGRYVLGLIGALFAFWVVSYVFFDLPKAQRLASEKYEIETRLPSSMKKMLADIRSEAKDDISAGRAEAALRTGMNAVSSKDLKTARSSEEELSQLLENVRQEYEIRILNRKGQVSGFWRVPKVNQKAQNYYIVVGAVASDGSLIERWIRNEETGKREKVKVWAERVSRQVFEAVRDDKQDDGIIQNALVGRKVRGELNPRWEISVLGGAITKWN